MQGTTDITDTTDKKQAGLLTTVHTKLQLLMSSRLVFLSVLSVKSVVRPLPVYFVDSV
jgi:hypothetical protein